MDKKQYYVSLKLLLSFYLIIPLCVVIQLTDLFFFNGALKMRLPLLPNDYFIINSLFGAPHIIAGTTILVSNTEYYYFYKNKLWLATLGIILFLVACSLLLPFEAIFFLFATFSIAHLIKQQLGISNAAYRLSGWLYQLWCWSGILAGIVLYNCIILRASFSDHTLKELQFVMLALTIIFAVLTGINQRRVKGALAVSLLWSNFSMVGVPVYLYSQDYIFLAMLGPRVIHDITAFLVYMIHDQNRHGIGPKNRMFMVAKKYHIRIILVTPIIGIIVAYLLQYQLDNLAGWLGSRVFGISTPIAIAIGVLSYFNLMHYYTETFTWSGKSPLRKFVSFKP